MDEHTAYSTTETGRANDILGRGRAGEGSDVGDGVDFASRRAARNKMQLWLTAFTAAAAVAILAAVSLSVLHVS